MNKVFYTVICAVIEVSIVASVMLGSMEILGIKDKDHWIINTIVLVLYTLIRSVFYSLERIR